jgi:hypothetical protein
MYPAVPMAANQYRPTGLLLEVQYSGEINAYACVSTPDD